MSDHSTKHPEISPDLAVHDASASIGRLMECVLDARSRGLDDIGDEMQAIARDLADTLSSIIES